MEVKKALTLGEVARRLNCPIHRVKYLIQARRIEPVERAGNLRVFGPEILELLRTELNRRCPADVSPALAGGAVKSITHAP